jgi:hypothetical protein
MGAEYLKFRSAAAAEPLEETITRSAKYGNIRRDAPCGQGEQMRRKVFGIVAGLLLGAPACAQQWFTVSGARSGVDETLVEIDLETVRIRNHGGEGVIRVTFDVMQAHGGGFAFRSFVATTQLDCVRRTIVLTSAAYYAQPAAQGQRVGTDSSGKEAGMPPQLLEKIPVAARQALLKATCTPTQN